jgi:peptidoglycan/xylan/chitin deacetylase (PgdA/CDA1 family)
VSALTIVMYHYVRPIQASAYPGMKGLELEGFRRQLDHLASKFVFVSPQDLINAVKGEALPSDACLLTFDDGYKDHIDFVFPELVKRKLSGAFFPPAQAITERRMLDVNLIHLVLARQPDSLRLIDDIRLACLGFGVDEATFKLHWDNLAKPSRYDSKEIVFIKRVLQHGLPEDVRRKIAEHLFRKYVSVDLAGFADTFYLSTSDCRNMLAAGMYIGCHGFRHVWFNKISKADQELEIDLSLRFLGDIGAATQDWMMCYPYGGYNEDTLDVLRAKNCCAGLTTKVATVDMKTCDNLQLPRFDTNDFPQ